MIEVSLQPVANQSLSVTVGGARYDLTIKEAGGVMCADVSRDSVVLVRGSRLVAKTPVLPYRHQEAGNFLLATADDDLPYYDKFGVTQFLYYLTAAELVEARG